MNKRETIAPPTDIHWMSAWQIREAIVTRRLSATEVACHFIERIDKLDRRLHSFFTVSGEAATRGSDGSISLATAIFMRPPGAAGARASKLASFSLSWIPVSQPACVQIFWTPPAWAVQAAMRQVRK